MQKRIYLPPIHFLIYYSPLFEFSLQYDIILLLTLNSRVYPGCLQTRTSTCGAKMDIARALANILVHISILSSISVAQNIVSGSKQDRYGVHQSLLESSGPSAGLPVKPPQGCAQALHLSHRLLIKFSLDFR